MSTFITLLILASLLAAAYFFVRWLLGKLRHTGTKRYLRSMWLSLLAMVVLTMVLGTAFPAEKTTSEADTAKTNTSKRASSKKSSSKKRTASSYKSKTKAKNSADTKQSKVKHTEKKASSKESKKKSESQKKTYDFSKIKLGMTKSEIVKIIGKPDSDISGNLSYGDDYLALNDDGKLFSGSPDSIQKQIDAKNKAKKESSSNKADQLKSFAKAFGQKDVQTLQKYVGSAYSSTETPDGMAYGWKTDYGMLYRLDDSSTGITHVYKDGLGDKGTELYAGQTIKTKPKYYYHTVY
ncbi:hypothetical protein [Lactiplantibacillus modestisalitolerans]|uniref:Uncharacterized protein n=1 Tax=Lactiplantibacillus modestisalitolerans TaxID=1457219 RepID=A0ABV5WX94_9LACO|nr:hypothetical protein [Lactiplantibacillus modestisalitolerans]